MKKINWLYFILGIKWKGCTNLNALLNRNRVIFAWLLILPAIFFRLFTALYPVVRTLYLSLFEVDKIKRTMIFIGLKNFINMFQDPEILNSFFFTFFFTFTSIVLHVILALGLALLLNANFKGQKFLRTINLIPWAMPLIVASTAALWMYNRDVGLINDLLFRFFRVKVSWLSTVWGARWSVILVDVWKDTSFMAILLLAGLQGIPQNIYEAARVDGAGPFRTFFNITLPLLRSVLVTSILFFTLWRLNAFELVYGLTKGGPGTATALLSYRVYTESFKNLSYGYASAVAVSLFFIIGIIGLIGFAILKKTETY